MTSVPVSSVDWVATLTGTAGTDGVDMKPVLQGRQPSTARPLFWHYPHYSNQGGEPGAAVRLGEYKLIRFYADDHRELYNLRSDPGEKSDLASKMTAKRDELARLWMAG